VNRAGRNRAVGAEQLAVGYHPRVGSPWEVRPSRKRVAPHAVPNPSRARAKKTARSLRG
jgi:hypothetical protein